MSWEAALVPGIAVAVWLLIGWLLRSTKPSVTCVIPLSTLLDNPESTRIDLEKSQKRVELLVTLAFNVNLSLYRMQVDVRLVPTIDLARQLPSMSWVVTDRNRVLDEEALYYLRVHGLDRNQAIRIATNQLRMLKRRPDLWLF